MTFGSILEGLIPSSSCSAGNKHNFRTVTYEATSAYLSGATVDAVVQNTVVAVLTRMEQVLNMQNQIPGVEHNNWNGCCRPTSTVFL
ncbi:hypothetical protein C8F04DRAFT_230325 [Mycena alexandri]|uniref:Importin subunit beta-1/Transportin-1-like TPR repeats domain-containing protein n=1 Tax=Mycena alexandri TaxID=1745969 RepID=A0AAD6WPZ5_9AGAR|nr:hypothetical protein C8F04DRAFT_230325 [Mycena alexandri]